MYVYSLIQSHQWMTSKFLNREEIAATLSEIFPPKVCLAADEQISPLTGHEHRRACFRSLAFENTLIENNKKRLIRCCLYCHTQDYVHITLEQF